MKISRIQNISLDNMHSAMSKMSRVRFKENAQDSYTKSNLTVTSRKSGGCGCDDDWRDDAVWGINC